MTDKEIIFSDNFQDTVLSVLHRKHYDKCFLLTDSNVEGIYRDFISSALESEDIISIIIPEGDENKDLESLAHVWKFLGDNGASRHSCLINFGGGMVTDLGGFAASTFKRGIDFINVPTTLLAMVDASAGGKTAINFNGLKNEVGVFSEPQSVIIHPEFLNTLDDDNFLSGYAEMLKHSLIESTAMWAEMMNYDLQERSSAAFDTMLRNSIAVKSRIVDEDPYEKGIRKILNLGHTFGHAFESFSHTRGRGILHGYAVAYGLVCELYLSTVKLSFPVDVMRTTVKFIHDYYGTFPFTCNDYEQLLQLMQHDKKNCNGMINFSLLRNIGQPEINCHATKDDIFEAFDFLREGF